MITDLVNAYIGDSSVSRLYQGDNLIWDSSHPDILLEYICTGNKNDIAESNIFFDTSIQFSKDIKIETKCLPWGGYSIIGMIGGWTNCPYYGLAYDINNNGIHFYCGSYDGNGVEYSVFKECDENVHTITTYFTNSNICMTLDGSTVIGDSFTSLPVFPGTISLFPIHGGPESKIYYVKMWENNNLVRFYIPVLHWLNDYYVPCFYDKVNDNYVYSDWFNGRGFPENFNHQAYPSTIKISGDYLLNYIQCGNDYLDQSTGVRCYIRFDPQLPVDLGYEMYLKANPGNAYYGSDLSKPQEAFVIGERTPGASKIGLYMPNQQYGIRLGWLSVVMSLDSTLNPAGNDYTMSISIDPSTRKRTTYANGTKVVSSGSEASEIPEGLVGANIYINKCGAANVWSGNKYYYIIFDKFGINQRTYIPVLHNGQAMFLDLSNSTYMQHTVDSGSGADNTLLYQFK